MELDRNAIAEILAEREVVLREQSGQVVESMFEAIVQALATGEEVALSGFGRFSLRPTRARANVRKQPGRTVSFRAGRQLLERINAGISAQLERMLAWVPPVERRRQPRELAQDGTAIVRVSGIPVCEFKLHTVSPGGSSFWVQKDAFILRNIHVGQEIEIRIQKGSPADLLRARIAHISPSDDPRMDDYIVMGVQTLDKLPMQ
jgi:DNA-binding protein HU-beta